MPKRIEHTIVDGVEHKRCTGCKEYKHLEEYSKTERRWDGLDHLCKDCCRRRAQSPRRAALEAYRMLRRRVETRHEYVGIECRIDREDFAKWYAAHYFPGCIVDRIANNGHYEAGNLQLISRTQHNHKLRNDNLAAQGIVETVDERYCYHCQSLKPLTEFGRKSEKVSAVNPLGLKEECKACCRKSRRTLYQKKKEPSP